MVTGCSFKMVSERDDGENNQHPKTQMSKTSEISPGIRVTPLSTALCTALMPMPRIARGSNVANVVSSDVPTVVLGRLAKREIISVVRVFGCARAQMQLSIRKYENNVGYSSGICSYQSDLLFRRVRLRLQSIHHRRRRCCRRRRRAFAAVPTQLLCGAVFAIVGRARETPAKERSENRVHRENIKLRL